MRYVEHEILFLRLRIGMTKSRKQVQSLHILAAWGTPAALTNGGAGTITTHALSDLGAVESQKLS